MNERSLRGLIRDVKTGKLPRRDFIQENALQASVDA